MGEEGDWYVPITTLAVTTIKKKKKKKLFLIVIILPYLTDKREHRMSPALTPSLPQPVKFPG